MLNIVRRGPASIAKPFIAPFNSPKCINSELSQNFYRLTDHGRFVLRSRALHTTSKCRQNAFGVKSLENDANDESNSQGSSLRQSASSGIQSQQARNYGPVTKFEELAQRKMVCDTVVKTITDAMGLKTMTHVQSLTINETLKGIDV